MAEMHPYVGECSRMAHGLHLHLNAQAVECSISAHPMKLPPAYLGLLHHHVRVLHDKRPQENGMQKTEPRKQLQTEMHTHAQRH